MAIRAELLTKQLRDKALALGFDTFGVAAIREVPELAHFASWLDHGYAGDMAYLHRQREKRLQPAQVVPNARSIIICALNYHTEAPLSTDPAPADTGWISRYAWGDDYHEILTAKIRALYEALVEMSGKTNCGRYYVDTGPVLEKVWAKYAGAGWIGKNTCLLNEELGSFLFLAAIVTDIELITGEPAPDRCGSCTRCIDACPTGAIFAPYVLDANLCISYLTIEKRNEIAPELRDQMGRHIYGCDICQDVCPWNRKAPHSTEPAFRARRGAINPPIRHILELDEPAYRERFRHSPMKRAKLTGLQRNALIAAGNSGVTELAPDVAKFAQDENKTLQEVAQWALKKLRNR